MTGSKGSPAALWRIARTLGRRARQGKALPPLLFFTDPVRTPDPAAVIAGLPRGAAVVYRAFGTGDVVNQGRILAALARRRGLLFLVGADEALAMACRADGLHLPERMAGRAPLIRARHPRWLITAAAHSPLALARRSGLDASVLSPVLASRSPSAGKAIGPLRTAAWVRRAGTLIYGLGGISASTAGRLRRSGLIGLAAIDGLALPGHTGRRG